MKKLNKAALGFSLVLALGTSQAQAETAIDEILYDVPNSGYYNCAYKLKIASKKCLVTTSRVKPSIDDRAQRMFSANERLPLITIKWPDGDVSRYLDIGGDTFYKLINLDDRSRYNYRTYNNEALSVDFSNGLVIENSKQQEHIRLW